VVAPSSGRHWDLLDGLRGLAILMVVVSHAIYSNPDGPQLLVWLSTFSGKGAYGVQMFFVLSGFLISYPFFAAKLKNSKTWYPSGYVARRCLKIFPPYYLTIVLLAVYYFGRYHDTAYLHAAWLWAVGIPHYSFLPLSFNNSFWSLWVELEFYLMLPVFFWALQKRSIWPTAIIMSATLLVVPFVTRSLIPEGSNTLFLAGRFPNALTSFSWGILFAGFFVANRHRTEPLKHRAKLGYGGLLLLGATLVLATWLSRNAPASRWTYELPLHLVGFATFLMLFLVFDPKALGARIFSSPIFKFIGLVSYEWFLLHQPFLLETRISMEGSHGSVGQYLLIVGAPAVVTFGLAVLIYHYFSTPIIRWGRARLNSPGATAR